MTSPSTIHLAHSPDSDDAFMFYALADGQITPRVSTTFRLRTSKTLNRRALRGGSDVTGLDHAYACLSDRYALLPTVHRWAMGCGQCRRVTLGLPGNRWRRIAVQDDDQRVPRNCTSDFVRW
jgi:hypothetical protein